MTLKNNYFVTPAISFFQYVRRSLLRLMAWTGKGRSALASCRS